MIARAVVLPRAAQFAYCFGARRPTVPRTGTPAGMPKLARVASRSNASWKRPGRCRWPRREPCPARQPPADHLAGYFAAKRRWPRRHAPPPGPASAARAAVVPSVLGMDDDRNAGGPGASPAYSSSRPGACEPRRDAACGTGASSWPITRSRTPAFFSKHCKETSAARTWSARTPGRSRQTTVTRCPTREPCRARFNTTRSSPPMSSERTMWATDRGSRSPPLTWCIMPSFSQSVRSTIAQLPSFVTSQGSLTSSQDRPIQFGEQTGHKRGAWGRLRPRCPGGNSINHVELVQHRKACKGQPRLARHLPGAAGMPGPPSAQLFLTGEALLDEAPFPEGCRFSLRWRAGIRRAAAA